MTITSVIVNMLDESTAAEHNQPQQQQANKQATLASSFPAGLRVLLVDDDPVCLMVIGQMLRACQYEVCTCSAAASALDQLRDKSHNFDLVLSDVYMPDMDGFKLLEIVGLELGLPVIMMSANDEHSTVMRGVTHGACDFLIKPVRIEELKNIWQHVVRRSRHNAAVVRDAESDDAPGDQDADSSRKRNVHSRDGSCNEGQQQAREEEGAASKKPRVVWSVEMHQQFVQAVNQLGIDKAVPKKILELMKVDGLTRENVASHLQKYRLYLKRVQQNVPQQGGNAGNASAAAAAAAGAGAGSFTGGMGLPGMVAPNQMMWGGSKQLMDAMQAQQQVAAATVQQAAGGQQMMQQGQQQQGQAQQMGAMGADGGMGGLLGMMPSGGLMSPMGQMMPGMNMGMGLPGMGPMSGMGSAAAAGGMMGLPGMPGFGAAMMGLMPGMAGLPGAMQGMAGAMNPMGQLPGMRPGMAGGHGDPASVMAMMSMFQAQQAAPAAAANLPTTSGGGSSGGLVSPQQQQQQQAQAQMQAQGVATAGLPTPTAAGMPGMMPSLVGSGGKQEPAIAMMGTQGSGAAMANMQRASVTGGMQQPAAAMAAATAGMRPAAAMSAAAVQPSAALPSTAAPAGMPGPEFGNVFDDLFEVPATQPVTAAAAATAGAPGARGGDEEFLLDFILKGS